MKKSIRLSLAHPAILAFVAVAFAVGIVACDSGPVPTQDDLTGTVSGQVVDNATSAPLEGASVTLTAGSLDTGDAALSATTNSNGEFVINGVPVTRGSGESETTSATYGLRLESNNDSYRSVYRGQVEVRFGDGGSSAVEGLVANVTFPLSKTNGTVTGKVLYGDAPLNNAELGFVQHLPVQFDGDGNPTQHAEVRTTTTTTDSEGNFTFNDAEVDTDFDLEVRIEDGGQVITGGSVPGGEDATLEVGELDVSSRVAPLKITDVTPSPDSDVDATDPSIAFTFNRPVVENEFTSENLADGLTLSPTIAKSAKDLRTDGTLPIEIAFDSSRTTLTVTPAEPLEDGYIYNLNAGGFNDDHFTDAHGIPLGNPNKGTFEFSVGADKSAPAVPSVTLFESFFSGGPDYPVDHGDVRVGLEIDVDNSNAEVKGYEVYARTQDMRSDRTGEGGQFKKVRQFVPLDPFNDDELDGSDYREFEGIIDVGEADSKGVLQSAVLIEPSRFNGVGDDQTLLAADDGSYGPVEWKVRAVSINNERSDFSNVIAVGDSVGPSVDNATATDTDNDGNDDIITIEFSEALDTNTASNVDNYTLEDDAGSPRDILESVEEVLNNNPDNTTLSTDVTKVVINLADGNSVNDGAAPDEIIVDDETTSDPVIDLAGNGVRQSANSWTF